MELKFTPKVIEAIEIEAGKPITDVLADFSLSTITLLVRSGLGVSKEEAFDRIEKYLLEEKDTLMLYTEIMEALQKAGFLPRALNIKKVKDDMGEALKK